MARTWATVALATALLGCEGNDAAPVQHTMRGLAVTQGATTHIIVGMRDDLNALLADSLAGVETDEDWFRYDIPSSLLPAADAKTTFDLETDQDIGIVVRWYLANPANPTLPRKHYTFVMSPNPDLRLTGKVEIAGPDSSSPVPGQASGNWGVAMAVNWDGYLMFDADKVSQSGDAMVGHGFLPVAGPSPY